MINNPIFLYMLFGIKIASIVLLVFYFKHILTKGVLGKILANIILVPSILVWIYGMMMIYNEVGHSFNLNITIDHLLVHIPIIILCLIGINRKK